MGNRGIAWAMSMSYDARAIVYVVAGNWVVGRPSNSKEYFGFAYPSGGEADAAAAASAASLEAEGAFLVAGPVEFDVPRDIFDAGDESMAQQIGALAERALKLRSTLPDLPAPSITVGATPPAAPSDGDIHFEVEDQELRMWDGKQWLSVSDGSSV